MFLVKLVYVGSLALSSFNACFKIIRSMTDTLIVVFCLNNFRATEQSAENRANDPKKADNGRAVTYSVIS